MEKEVFAYNLSDSATHGAMTQAWHLIALWGFVVGFGTGMTAMVLGATVATRWFVAHRGLVVGILAASVGRASGRVSELQH